MLLNQLLFFMEKNVFDFKKKSMALRSQKTGR